MARTMMIETRNGFSPSRFRIRPSFILTFMLVASLLFGGQGVLVRVPQALLGETPIERTNHWDNGGVAEPFRVTANAMGTPGSLTLYPDNSLSGSLSAYLLSVVPSSGRGTSYAISGVITPAVSGSGATLSLAGVASATTTADGAGNYSLGGLANGRYAITPSKDGYSFSPASQAVTINDADVADVNFTATAVHPTYTISGSLSPAPAGEGVTITLSGAASLTTIADASGNYSFSGLSNGSYTVKPSKPKATFNPASQAVTINEANVTSVNFTVMTRGSE
jgi:SdrD B-like domain